MGDAEQGPRLRTGDIPLLAHVLVPPHAAYHITKDDARYRKMCYAVIGWYVLQLSWRGRRGLMKSEDQPGALPAGDAQAAIDSESGTRHAAHRNAELHAMWSRWMLAALALLQNRAQIVAPDYDVTLHEDGHSSAFLGPERPNMQLTVDAYAGDLMTHPDFLALAEFIVSTPALATGIQMASSLPSSVTQEELSALWRVGRVFLLEYLAIDDKLNFRRELIEHLYDRLEEYIFQS